MSVMLLKTLVFLVVIVAINSENVRVKRSKYYSYPARFYRKPPPPHVIKGPYSYTPPPNYMQDDEPTRPKVSKKPINDGLGDEDIHNLMKHLTKKDLDKIVEFAGGKERFIDKYRDDSKEQYEYKPGFRRPERNTGYKNEDIEQFEQNIHHFKDQDDMRIYKVEYNDQMNYGAVKPRILHPTPPNIPDDFDKNPNWNQINDASQSKVMYTNPQEFNTKVTYSNHQDPSNTNMYYNSQEHLSQPFSSSNWLGTQQFSNNIPSSNPNKFSQGPNLPLPEESMHQYISYVTVPPNYENKESIFTDSNGMKEEQLPKPLNLREEDYETANTNNDYRVESLKDLPLMNFHNSKLHTVSSYNVPHYLVTSTKSQQVSQPPQVPQPKPSSKAPQIETAPPGYSGREMSDAHLKAVKIWTHRSKGTAYTLHDDGSLSLEKPKIKTSYGYTP